MSNRLTAFLAGTALVLVLGALAVPEPSLSNDPHWANNDCTKTERPPFNFTNDLKHRLVNMQTPGASLRSFELDHIGPLCLGGQPTATTNFQLQPWPEAIQKDALERSLCIAVHEHRISCDVARKQILEWRPQ